MHYGSYTGMQYEYFIIDHNENNQLNISEHTYLHVHASELLADYTIIMLCLLIMIADYAGSKT